jgi:HPt (histidine-containing phosphotransfer) domain-containing protein
MLERVTQRVVDDGQRLWAALGAPVADFSTALLPEQVTQLASWAFDSARDVTQSTIGRAISFPSFGPSPGKKRGGKRRKAKRPARKVSTPGRSDPTAFGLGLTETLGTVIDTITAVGRSGEGIFWFLMPPALIKRTPASKPRPKGKTRTRRAPSSERGPQRTKGSRASTPGLPDSGARAASEPPGVPGYSPPPDPLEPDDSLEAGPPSEFESTPDLAPPEDITVEDVLEVFFVKSADAIDLLNEAASVGSAEELRATAHALKSSCRNVGAHVLAGICEELEGLDDVEALAGAFQWIDLLEQELGHLKAAANRP